MKNDRSPIGVILSSVRLSVTLRKCIVAFKVGVGGDTMQRTNGLSGYRIMDYRADALTD